MVAKVRRLANTRKVGHAGTLDPMATGLLILGLNSATKLLTFLVGEDKTYEATIRLGSSTVTDDREGETLTCASAEQIASLSDADIQVAMGALRGEILQVPSSVSAIKVNGERAYAKVRSGDEVKLAARPVTISRFDLVGQPKRVDGFIDIHVVIDCSSGTYVRAIARDLGAALKVGGHLTALRRTRVGSYRVEEALTLEALGALPVLPILDLAAAATQQFEHLVVSQQQMTDLRHGKRLSAAGAKYSGPIAAVSEQNQMIAMLEQSGNQLKSLVVFNQPDSE